MLLRPRQFRLTDSSYHSQSAESAIRLMSYTLLGTAATLAVRDEYLLTGND